MGEILRAMARRNTRRWATGLALAGVLATGPGLAAAEGFRGEWGGGPTVRMVETHFIDSTSFPTETWTNYSFFGVRGEGR